MEHIPFARSTELPPYRAILAVDAKGFTAEPGSTHEAISKNLLDLVGDALDGAGLPTRVLPYLVDPFPRLLQERLAEHNRQARPHLQLRVSLHVGAAARRPRESPLDRQWGSAQRHPPPARFCAGEGRARRGQPARDVRACIFSERVFEDVIAAGYAGMQPDRCLPVTATVDGKAFSRQAWLYLPEVSGNLLGVLPAGPLTAPPPAVAKPERPRISGPRVKRNDGQVATTVESMTQHRDGAR